MRRTLWLAIMGFGCGWGCGLLTPYPGSEDAAEVLGRAQNPRGGSPIDGGIPQDPLTNPAIDDTITVVSDSDVIVAVPGESFIIELGYTARQANVIGGGIQFPNSDEVQWTLIESLRDTRSGTIRFGYAVPEDICDDVPNLCHALATKQFAVAENVAPDGDVDGDGEEDGDFVVSQPAEVTVVLRCSTCESTSCVETLPAGECINCVQPEDCRSAYEICFAPGQPKYDTGEGIQFVQFFGEDGLAWKTPAGCAAAEELCRQALVSAEDECLFEDTGTGGESQ